MMGEDDNDCENDDNDKAGKDNKKDNDNMAMTTTM